MVGSARSTGRWAAQGYAKIHTDHLDIFKSMIFIPFDEREGIEKMIKHRDRKNMVQTHTHHIDIIYIYIYMDK